MQKGSITLITGPMFAGKSAWLIKTLQKHFHANDALLAVRYAKDTRYAKNAIASHNGTEFLAESAENSNDVKMLIDAHTDMDVFAIDEIQFFDANLVSLLLELRELGVIVYAGGLDLDFLANPWETTTKVSQIADKVLKLHAICTVCHKNNATKTQRLINGTLAPKDSPRVVFGNTEMYLPRCDLHYQIINAKSL